MDRDVLRPWLHRERQRGRYCHVLRTVIRAVMDHPRDFQEAGEWVSGAKNGLAIAG